MRSSQTNDGPQSGLHIPPVWWRAGWTKQTAAAIPGALTLAVLYAVLLIASRPARAQVGNTLYNFSGGSDGGYASCSLISDGAGNFYGTTTLGGLPCPSNSRGCGTVFEFSPDGSGGWKETVLYTFTGAPDGALPEAPVIFDKAGNLYGTTSDGGAFYRGTVFELSPVGSSWTETVLHTFTGQGDGARPNTGLIMDQAGNVYGATEGDNNGPGSIFELSRSGADWTETTIYPSGPFGGLTMDATGNIYATGLSIVLELSRNGGGGWDTTVLHTFTGYPQDGMNAEGTLVFDQGGNLFGITYSGGAKNDGTVYKLSPGQNGQWTEQILYSFKNGKDGRQPSAGVVLDAAGNIYGTTARGGALGPKHQGTVFELLAPAGAGDYKEKVLYSFYGPNGTSPNGILDSAGNLYGTTALGGTSNSGVVFEVTPPTVTATTLTSSPNPSTYGQVVTFTAVVTPAPPDGETISLMKGKTVLGTGSLSGGSASFVTSALPRGGTRIAAVYGGDPRFSGSTSNTVRQVVKIATKQTHEVWKGAISSAEER
jgi:uncharacterized repeat protein (TIGR03803 family)